MAKKQSCKVRNWKDYNRTLVKRGSLILWFDEDSIKKWHKPDRAHRGRPRVYADVAILCMLTLKMVFKLPLRATQGLVASIIELLEPVQNLFNKIVKKASTVICRLVAIFLSQFFHSRRNFSNQANALSTTQRLGRTTNRCGSLRLAI